VRLIASEVKVNYLIKTNSEPYRFLMFAAPAIQFAVQRKNTVR
jgi:hypothetical protein